MKRTISRIKVLFQLYQLDLLKNEETEFDFNNYLDDDIEYDIKFSQELFDGIITNLSRIDRIIALNLTNYPLDRLSYVDRALLRIGTYELTYTNTPKEIIINEIVNLSKEYSQTETFTSSKFNNSVLDNIAKKVSK